jgi:hypothetical protein
MEVDNELKKTILGHLERKTFYEKKTIFKISLCLLTYSKRF